MKTDFLEYPYNSRRMTTFAPNGAVATSQPLAAQAGLDILKKGGNAIDAAIATAACLTVVEPTSNGIGGDAFALIWANNELYGINGSGHTPQHISRKKVRNRGFKEIPKYGWIPVTVPGVPGTWAEINQRFGKLSLQEILKPAIEYAEKGYPISPITGKHWRAAFKKYKKKLKGEQFKPWFNTVAPEDRPPNIGERWSSKGHAETLRAIGKTNAKSFYQGKIADKIIDFSDKYNGFLQKEDLSSFSTEWVKQVKVNYRGFDVWELPPNGQGITALMALGMLEDYQFNNRESVETYHKQIEAMKLALTDGKAYITDLNQMNYDVSKLLSKEYLNYRRNLITEKALSPKKGNPAKGGTVYLASADNKGNMVSFIQSNYMGFGSGLVVPETGIALQNRGHLFSMNPEHENTLRGNKRTYHTIIPGFLTKNNRPIGPFGVMGGYMQPQGHIQVIMNTIDFNLNPQAALDAPRWQWVDDKKVLVESSFPKHIAQKLSRRGHNIKMSLNSGSFGRGQIIWKDIENDSHVVGIEPRTDSCAAVY